MINILRRTVGIDRGVIEGIDIRDNAFPNVSAADDKFVEALRLIAELVNDLDDLLGGERAAYRIASSASAVRDAREFLAAHNELLK
ncbi:hypothetical protein FHW96_000251 [Novosphingobium sp. SG751A]|uniref:hypothetical protein n=1 Tax=Novosphingobium sp. SG751A TaxID=2587000 RepID=UPI001557C3F8|nr:hypothetical protein [Novosphingobium sp. SG751A]NOW44124.1 hypothetical protein [Novosphingobium sp. SG751A]